MHIPSATSGDIAVWNRGTSSEKSLVDSFRQTTLPLWASRQESTPPTPKVTTFPSATVGELRGPGCALSGPETCTAGYLSCQMIFPLFASRQEVTSLSSWREKA